jgi:hypothetical protein
MTAARAEIVAGLRALADFIEAHPGLPLPQYGQHGITVHSGTDTGTCGEVACRTEVDAAAATLERAPVTTIGGHYQVSRTFGGGVSYRLVRIPAEVMARHAAEQSYCDNIQLSDGAA